MLTKAEYHRYLLMATILLIPGWGLTPITRLVLGMNSVSLGISIILAFAAIVSHIKHIPIKVILPTFLLSILANILVTLSISYNQTAPSRQSV